MKPIARFEKVSFEQYAKDVGVSERTMDALKKDYDEIQLPTRATKLSAGYDFRLPIPAVFFGGEQAITIATGIRCKMEPGWMLALFPKSGLSFRNGTRLINTIAVIDADFYDSDNEGHIMVKMSAEKTLTLSRGDKFVQGIFIPCGLAEEDEVTEVRNGGFGSTGK